MARSSRWAWPGLMALIIACAWLYFIFLPVSYSFDGTVFSHMLRNSLQRHDWLGAVQIHHLLYFPCTYLAYRLLQACCHCQVLEFFHLQLFSLFFGIATLILAGRMLKKLGLDLWPRLAGVAAIAFSHAFWLYSVDAEVHIPGLFFTLAGMHLLLFRQEKTLPLAAAAFCFALATGFHLTNGLIVVTVILYLLARRAPWRRFAVFFGVFFAFLALLYGGYAALSGRPVFTILYNSLFGPSAYSGYHSSAFHLPAPHTVTVSLGALKNALAAGTGFPAWLLCAGFLALLALAVRPAAARSGSSFRLAMLFWSLPFFLFFTLWDPANSEFKIPVLLPLLLLAVSGLARLKPAIAAVIGGALSAGLLLLNLAVSIAPRADIRNNINYQVAAAIRKATPENAQVMITGNFLGYGYGKIYIPYFAGREVIILDWVLGKGRTFSEIQVQLEGLSRSGRELYALSEIAAPGESMDMLLASRRIAASDFSRFRSAFHFVPVAALANGQRLFRMEFAPSKAGGAGLQ